MSEHQNLQEIDSELLSLLESTDLTNVETTRALLRPAMLVFKIVEFQIKPTKNGTPQLNFKFSLEQTAKDTKDNEVQPGKYSLWVRTLLKPTGEWTQKHTDEALARIKEGVMGTKAGAFGHPSNYVGRKVLCNVIIRPAEGQYPEQNEINKLVHITGA